MYTLDYGEKQPLNGYTNYYTFMQLELFCQWLGKWDKIPYVLAFMFLHNKNLAKKGNNLMMHRRELASKPLPHSKTRKKRIIRK